MSYLWISRSYSRRVSAGYPMQGFRNEEAKSQAQLNFEAEQQAWFEDFMKTQQEKMVHPQSAILSDVDQEHVISENEEKVAQIWEEERSEIKEDDALEDKTHNEQELDYGSSKDIVAANLEDIEDKEANGVENEDNEEIQVDMSIIIQECDETGLSNPINDILPYEFPATTLHCLIPSLKVELNCDFLKFDDAYFVSDNTEIHDDDSC
ncbi:hypothetical protein BRADI_2g28880v3 [Brachypodium distachyon]|uniref:Uncharacterized protein n=1 Tax=Brachypodium distachyon TaxID=15368 RepID=A0A0Q3G5Z4_BRADI|nr:hypothetical protein BRADI_2g28880v3 [Brachypodium distachyon]PNT71511.1 hypothetical protein BRADI_2g28880v3 [Brachypodium distachyon]PNT71512.1 hypothetical protein BRADI_2g28880v3 [Brachypodium distachyon]